MRNTKIAMAVLALVASSAAMAEGVTIYGTLDAGIANTTYSGEAGLGTYVSGGGGYSYGNNIGFKGSEEIAGGLKANFQLEAGIDLNSGHPANGGAGFVGSNNESSAISSPVFNRVSTVGLSGDFGSVNVGQQLSPFISAALSSILSNGHFGVNRLVIGGAAAGPSSDITTAFPYGGFFVPNSISYTAPSLAGWTVSALTSTKTGTQAGSVPLPVDTERYSAISLTGAIETVNIAVAYENRTQSYKNWVAGATMNVGDIQLAANYMNSKAEGVDAITSYALGVGYNVTPVLNVNAQYTSNQDTDKALTALTGKYTLSKRTSVYASYLRGTGGAVSNYDERNYNNASGVSTNTTVVGLAHSF